MAALGWRMAKEKGFHLFPKSPETVKATAAEKASPIEKVPPTLPDREAFLPHLRSEFQIREDAAGGARAVLIEVSAVQIAQGHLGTFGSFSLMFEVPRGFLAEGGICKVQHEKMGDMSFFLSPIGRSEKDKSRLEAVFSQRMS